MESPLVFTCQNCQSEMEVGDPRSHDRIACRRCGRTYHLGYSDTQQAWILHPEQPVEPEAERQRSEEPFSVLGEVGRPKRVDRSEKHREQSGRQPSEDVPDDRYRREP